MKLKSPFVRFRRSPSGALASSIVLARVRKIAWMWTVDWAVIEPIAADDKWWQGFNRALVLSTSQRAARRHEQSHDYDISQNAPGSIGLAIRNSLRRDRRVRRYSLMPFRRVSPKCRQTIAHPAILRGMRDRLKALSSKAGQDIGWPNQSISVFPEPRDRSRRPERVRSSRQRPGLRPSFWQQGRRSKPR